jgi:hypothetical protein
VDNKRIKIDGRYYNLKSRNGRIEVSYRDIHAVLPPNVTFETPYLKVIIQASVTTQRLKKRYERV